MCTTWPGCYGEHPKKCTLLSQHVQKCFWWSMVVTSRCLKSHHFSTIIHRSNSHGFQKTPSSSFNSGLRAPPQIWAEDFRPHQKQVVFRESFVGDSNTADEVVRPSVFFGGPIKKTHVCCVFCWFFRLCTSPTRKECLPKNMAFRYFFDALWKWKLVSPPNLEKKTIEKTMVQWWSITP